MLKDFMWSTFEKTGNVDAYISYKEIEATRKALVETNAAEEEAAPVK